MLMIWLKRLVVGVAGLILSAVFVYAALPQAATPPKMHSLSGLLLIASPEMADPRFDHAVILIVQHSESGALGIMINRPVRQSSIASLLEAIGEKDTSIDGNMLVCLGGPVEPRVGFVVHSADYRLPASISIDGRVAMTTDPQILHDIGHNRGPRSSFFAFGYTGWGPGQLENELALHVWFTMLEEPKLIFDADRESVWTTAMARRMQDL
jgi:putative transcriptional regulator